MARFLLPARRLLLPKTSAPPPPTGALSIRSYISEMRCSAFKENLLRVLRTEIAYEAESRPPLLPAATFESFTVDDRSGEQWIRLTRKHGREDVKIDATMFDGAAPSKRSAMAMADEDDARLHISLLVEVSKGEASDYVLQFVCSAWPDSIDVDKVFPLRRGPAAPRPYMGPDFKELDEELQSAVREFLEERGVNDDLAEFLHGYMANKDKTELLRLLRNVESYVKK
ncbi:hypothetical protein COCNU_01G005450 [Cocos nucifera]|uniref:Mitochondrial glycoprotein n=1 Tax=Cocos nucifera TaxID=13894 RepID=A0A8K0HU26_COCNU|nr:hypothetical protein COCNU_01G005450 [Cocos nucifera]